jgi:hypothetical protein
VKRSACDQCRAKRVRCLRGQDSMASCARCCYTGARCVTGPPGHPGRPHKQRHPISSRDVQVHSPAIPEPAHLLETTIPDHEDFWVAPNEIFAQAGHPDSLSQHQELISTDDDLNAMLHMSGSIGNFLDMNIDPLFDYRHALLPPTPLPQRPSAANSLMKFKDKVDQHIASMDAYYSDPLEVLQHCKEEGVGQDVENPAVLPLTCTKELIDIVQSLTPAVMSHAQTKDALSTELVLMILSGYLALMRLFDSSFHRIYRCLCQMPPESYENIKVKSVLRISGISSLHDMPLKGYAVGIIDAIKGQVRVLENRVGIPAEYRLSDEVATAHNLATPGLLSTTKRRELFSTVITQEDIKSHWGSRSYAESIQASITKSIAFLAN